MSRMSTQSTKGGQYEEISEGIRAYEVGRARVHLKGKVLAIAAHSDSGSVNAGARCVSAMMQGKDNHIMIGRKLAEPPITSSSKQ